MAVKTSWSSGDVLTAADLTDTFAAKAPISTVGLTAITKASVTAGSTVSVNNCFTSTYENYLITINVNSVSADAWLNFRLRASGSDDSGSNYTQQNVTISSSTLTAGRTTATFMEVGRLDSADTGTFIILEIFRPQVAAETNAFLNTVMRTNGATNVEGWQVWMRHSQATAYDGFTLYPSTGNFTTSTNGIRVYGYTTP